MIVRVVGRMVAPRLAAIGYRWEAHDQAMQQCQVNPRDMGARSVCCERAPQRRRGPRRHEGHGQERRGRRSEVRGVEYDKPR